MKSPTISTPAAAYLASLPPDRLAAFTTLDTLIRNAAPNLEPHFQSGMLAYGKFHYKYPSGREGDWFIVGLCSRKSYMSLYICSADKNGYLAEQNASRLGKVKVGKSCITFKQLEDLDLASAAEVIKQAAKLGGAGAVM